MNKVLTVQDFIFKNVDINIPEKGSFTWKTPSNIALVKYWGKREPQIPKNPSISFTLDACFTITTLEFSKRNSGEKNINFDIYFEGEKKDDFKPKIAKFFTLIQQYVPFITDYDFVIHSRNSFPHSSGIASSASGMAALALCIMSLEKQLNPTITDKFFNKKASFLARLGSGSASRSIEGELVVWGKHNDIKDSSDLYGAKFPSTIHTNFKNYHDTILLVDKGEKQVSSTLGHNLMHNHPFAEKRFEQAHQNLSKLAIILQKGDLRGFINIVESEALTLHAMMLTSNPYFILMKPNTLSIINKIWEFRAQTNSNVCFTLDAGANVHVLFPEKEKKSVNQFIVNELLSFCQNNHYICDRVGVGAKQI
ncbi:MAG: diphosphomevalonate decarboxylase [Flavobacteriaceae bacterium]|nr:diphosphomevalonate decarboxylase [Flavobacteriaceae bacterium]